MATPTLESVLRDRIRELEIADARRKEKINIFIQEKLKLANNLYPEDAEDDETTDGEVVFDYGRGQGIFETVAELGNILSR